MKHLLFRFLLLLCLSSALLVLPAACAGPSYYLQAISGHFGLMHSRVKISELLEDPETDPELAQRLRKIQLMLEFAHEQLGLPGNGSYTRFAATGRNAVTWNVVVTPEFSLEPRLWCFPVAGCVSYRGYFDKQRAERFARKMEAKSFDVTISPAVAYSTLGWFADPVLDTMLQYSDATLAGIMFHELAHERLYVKSDTSFSEGFASFVEEIGVRRWLSQSGQTTAIEDWDNRTQAAIQFDRLLEEVRRQLEAVYASTQPDEVKRTEKERLFDALRVGHRALVATDWKGIDYFPSRMTGNLNNAYLALMESYEGARCAFEALYERAGHNLQQFFALADDLATSGKEKRNAWINQPCEGLAAVHDL